MERTGIYAISAVIAVVAIIGIVVTWIAGTNVEHSPPFTIDRDIFSKDTGPSDFESTQSLKKFSSQDELRKFLLETEERNRRNIGSYGGPPDRTTMGDVLLERAPLPTPPLAAPSAKQETSGSGITNAYSTTNVQVSNVDEPDFLKNDGKYVYILSNDILTIIDAYPPDSAKVVAKVGLDVKERNLQNMFLNKDKLVIFYQSSREDYRIEPYGYLPAPVYSPTTHALILDISDRENPKTVKDYAVTGNYLTARMIGDNVYFIANNPIDYRQPVIPSVMESSKTIMTPDVYYFDNPEQYYTFNTIAALDIFGGDTKAETFLMGSASTIYVSEDSIYITYTENHPYPYRIDSKQKFFDVIVPLLPQDAQAKIKSIENSNLDSYQKWNMISEILQDTYNRMPEDAKSKLFNNIQKALLEYDNRLLQDPQRTVIHKIAMDRLALKYSSKAEVPGHLLNQFSMDEFGKRFRIATTSEFYTPQGSFLANNVYVLDENLKIVGSLEKIAPRETIHSARFMGDRLYLVTFQRTDPFFVIDLSGDTLKVLGELKMPGYSDYLHPYDENHIIGIGRETKENNWGGVQTLGVKVALFDVSDVSHPVTVDVFTIGDQGTNSEVLSDHKALLFDRKKDVLSIPIESNIYSIRPMDSAPIEPKIWRGFYVFGVDAKEGFSLKGKVEHSSQSGYDYGYGSRSFYIGDVLYTVTNNLMKMNDLKDMQEINQVKLVNTGEVIKYIK